MRLQDTSSAVASPATLKVKAGQYSALFLRITGTNQSAQTLTAGNIGTVTLRVENKPQWSLEFDDLQTINNIDEGVVEAASASGAAFAFSARLLASRHGDGNVFHFNGSDADVVHVTMSGATATVVASVSIQLFAIPAEGSSIYMPQMFSMAPTVSANQVRPIELPHENISALYIMDPANVDRVQLEVDGEVISDGTWADTIANSNQESNLESAFTTGARIIINRHGSMGEFLTDDAQVTITAGGSDATPHLIIYAADFEPGRTQASISRVQGRIQAKFNRKFIKKRTAVLDTIALIQRG